jgi:hypothetical protein
LDALGGEERMGAIKTIEIQGTGAEYRGAEVQGWSPGKPTRTDHRETLVADFPHAPGTCCSRRGSIPTGWKGWRIPA